jgi:hypothetical protein
VRLAVGLHVQRTISQVPCPRGLCPQSAAHLLNHFTYPIDSVYEAEYTSPLIMHSRFFIASFLAPLATAQANRNTTYLIAPALVTKNNHTTIQCWKLTSPFKRSAVPGISGAQVTTLSNNTNLAYSILPPRFDGGLHTAPSPQLVHFLSGISHVTLPQDASVDLWIVGGKAGLLFAVDTTGLGHITRYPSDQETVAITAPFAQDIIPEHTVLKEGPCLGIQTFI